MTDPFLEAGTLRRLALWWESLSVTAKDKQLHDDAMNAAVDCRRQARRIELATAANEERSVA